MTRPTSAGSISGPARVDGSPLALLRRLKPGDVAILDAPDLDGRTAAALAACRPAAVVNAGRSLSGRLPSPGPLTLLDAGITVIDAAGEEVLAVREGASAQIEGSALTVEGRTFDAGVLLERAQLESSMRDAVEDLPIHVGSFTANALAVLQHESALLLTGEGIPELRVPVRDRAVVVVTPTFTGATKALRRFVRERRPVVIGVSGGADAARAAGLDPHIVIGDLEAASEDTVKRATQAIAHDADGHDAGRARAQALGILHDGSDAGLASEDLAVLAARAHGAAVIVVAGGRRGLLDYVEDRASSAGGALLVRLEATGTVVDAQTLTQLYRHRYHPWVTWGTFALAGAALLLAAWGTPEGHDAAMSAWEWLTTLGGEG